MNIILLNGCHIAAVATGEIRPVPKNATLFSLEPMSNMSNEAELRHAVIDRLIAASLREAAPPVIRLSASNKDRLS